MIIGICGKSGSGKSTLAKILSKQLGINNNLLFYNEKDIRSLGKEGLLFCICEGKYDVFKDFVPTL